MPKKTATVGHVFGEAFALESLVDLPLHAIAGRPLVEEILAVVHVEHGVMCGSAVVSGGKPHQHVTVVLEMLRMEGVMTAELANRRVHLQLETV